MRYQIESRMILEDMYAKIALFEARRKCVSHMGEQA